MLGVQTWFVALACPTILVGGFVASRKRLAYQWREELMDPDGTAYPPITDADMEFFRRVAPAAAVDDAAGRGTNSASHNAFGVSLAKEESIGLRVRSDVITAAEQRVYLNEVRRLALELGNALDPRKVAAFEERVHNECLLASNAACKVNRNASATSLIPAWWQAWLGGDGGSSESAGEQLAQPLTSMGTEFFRRLRVVSDHAEDIQLMRAPWGCGDRLRLEKLPATLRHLVWQTASAHDNLGRLRHVYIEYSPTGRFFREPRTPKAYDGHDYTIIPLRRDGGDTVVTFAPALRSKLSMLTDVMQSSWTSRDVDAFVPAGSILRVSGSARYDWGWGLRPGPAWFGSRLNALNRRIATDAKRDTVRSLDGANSNNDGPETSLPLSDAAIVVLHFEGPRAEGKRRSLLFQPEGLIFGKPPTAESYKKWVEDRPTREDVQKQGVIHFMAKRYFEMLTVS